MVEQAPTKLKIVVVGDGAIGKTCLVTSYGTNQFLDDYVPTVAASYSNEVSYDDKPYCLDIWDTSGQDEHKAMRVTSYNEADVVIVCFALNE